MESFLQGNAASYIDEMYRSWKVSPDSVHVSWRTYFRNIEEKQQSPTEAIHLPPGYLSSRDPALHSTTHSSTTQTADALRLAKLVSAYQSMGHRIANLDPLGLQRNGQPPHPERPPDLNPSYHGFTAKDMDREFALGTDILPHFPSQGHKSMSLRQIVAACESVYCRSYGIEYQHISSTEKREWLRERLERHDPFRFSRDEKKRILDNLIWSTSFERFIATKFPTEKRFGLDGSEGLAPGVASLIDQSVNAHGIRDIVIGSCHRGRLTMLGTVYGKPREAILAEFAGGVAADLPGMAGDVKYHLGHDGHRVTGSGNTASVTLLANPSHLEAVDPVATGFTYATQKMRDDTDRNRTMCIALHGDAAFAGQGVVYETLGLSKLDGYQVGGTVRVIVNNQIGFTTDAECSRSTPYPSDLAKYIDAPILHVNADDVEAVTFLFQLAADWRARFKEDIVIDLVCYRKFGHNEFDQPNFTQPIMYRQVAHQTPTMQLYIDKLVEQGAFTASEIKEQQRWVWDKLNNEFEASKRLISQRENFPSAWDSFPSPASLSAKTYSIDATDVDYSTLKSIADKVSSVPEGFELHPNLQRILAGRLSNFDEGSVDWSTAEALAFGTLCLEGHPVRLTGQDVQRGTFSQRHSVLHDQVTGQTWTPLNNLSPSQAAYEAINSPLSEFGALGFEYGFTLANPNPLVIWEAQFGDFANNTQVIIDNFMVSGESKWLDRSGLVLSLPHGYDGQGAEHSSARVERFLSMCNEDGRTWPSETFLDRGHQHCNMEIVHMTSPANYFHVLRRHLKRKYRKPLIIFFSKSLLRHPIARSDISLFTDPSASFQPVLADPAHGTKDIDSPENISRVIFCSGQVYASLVKRREDRGIRDTAITRIEELHPFPWREVEANLQKYPNVKNIVWTQEEPYNSGAWHYVRDRIDVVLRKSANLSSRRLLYSGRGPSASPATGLKKIHQAEEENLLDHAFTVQE
ncbi:thiamine diphosphate-binding protein [Fusarium acuminatum]|uniref:2-oxoglutarate dehydrogenase, mitochondrial n=1 Tax=Fusarium acuminatum TaxID=5515 RepID=A0ABZ2XCB1_9HYPO